MSIKTFLSLETQVKTKENSVTANSTAANIHMRMICQQQEKEAKNSAYVMKNYTVH